MVKDLRFYIKNKKLSFAISIIIFVAFSWGISTHPQQAKPLFWYFMGVAFVLSSLLDCLNHRNIILNGITTNATVFKTEREIVSSGEGSSYNYHPVFLYTVEGKQFKVKYSKGNIRPKFPDGTNTQIIYHKQNPEKICLPKEKTRIFLNVLYLILGIVFIIVQLNLQFHFIDKLL